MARSNSAKELTICIIICDTGTMWVEQFHSKPAEILMFLNGTLDAVRNREQSDKMLAAGLPL
jgi:hypothetical protein